MSSRNPGSDQEPAWVAHVRTGAEVAVTIGGAVLTLLDLLERHRQVPHQDEPQPLFPATTNTGKEELVVHPDDPDPR